MFPSKLKRLALLLALLGGMSGAPAEPAVVVGESPLLEAPRSDAKLLMTVPGGTHVDIVERRGVWFRVGLSPSGEPEGWMRFSQVRAGGGGEASSAKEGGVLSSLARQATGLFGYSGRKAPQSGGVVSTIGIRGLAAEDLIAAHPDPRELERMNAYHATSADASRFAAVIPLERQSIAYLEDESSGGPSSSSSTSSSSTSSGSSQSKD